jgi:hypothetical protein
MDWRLVDCLDPITVEDEQPETLISSECVLRQELERFQKRRPSIIQLHSPSREVLIIAIGGNLAGLRWMKWPMIENLKISVNPTPLTNESVEFREQGTDTGFRPRYLFCSEEVIEEVVYFFQHGKLSNRMEWISKSQV